MEAGHSFDLLHTPLPHLLSSQPGESSPSLLAPPPPHSPPLLPLTPRTTTLFFWTITFKCNTPLGVNHPTILPVSAFRLRDASGKQRARGKAHFTSGPSARHEFWHKPLVCHYALGVFPFPKAGACAGLRAAHGCTVLLPVSLWVACCGVSLFKIALKATLVTTGEQK